MKQLVAGDVFNFHALVVAYRTFVDLVVDTIASEYKGEDIFPAMYSMTGGVSFQRTLMYYQGNLLSYFDPYGIVVVGGIDMDCGCKGVAILDRNKFTVFIHAEEDGYYVERTLH